MSGEKVTAEERAVRVRTNFLALPLEFGAAAHKQMAELIACEIRAAEQAAREEEAEEIAEALTTLMVDLEMSATERTYTGSAGVAIAVERIRQRHAKKDELPSRYEECFPKGDKLVGENRVRDICREEIHHIVRVLEQEGRLVR